MRSGFKTGLSLKAIKEKRTGRYPAGRRASWKKAMVTLTADSKSIEFFDGMV